MTDTPHARLQVGGALGLDDLYIARPEDETAYELLAKREYVNILTSRQMGKSSLMIRLIDRLMRERQARVVSLDMAGDLGTPTDADRWYVGFLERVVRDLAIRSEDGKRLKVSEWWSEIGRGTPNQRLLQFFRDVVGATAESPVYVFIDEIDATLKLAYSDDFFTALRTVYNQRPTEPAFRELTFCLIGVASPFELIKDPRTTPYNIGHTVELRDFDPTVDDLSPIRTALATGDRDGDELLAAVLRWTGGHPFLTIAVSALVIDDRITTPEEIDVLLKTILAKGASQEIKDHLETISNFLANRLENQAASFKLYSRILRGKRVSDRLTPAHVGLRLSGLVKRNPAAELVSRNLLYRYRFGRSWLAQTKPMRKQARVLWAAIALSVFGLGGAAYGVRALWIAEQPEPLKRFMVRLEEAEQGDEASWNSARIALCDEMGKISDETAKERARDFILNSQAGYLPPKIRAHADAAFRGGREEEGFLLSALAAVLSGRLPDEVRTRYLAAPHHRRLIATLRGHQGRINRVRFLDRDVVTAGVDGTVRLFDLDTGAELKKVRLKDEVSLLEVCPDGKCVIADEGARTLHVLPVPDLRIGATLPPPEAFFSRIVALELVAHPTHKSTARIAIGGSTGTFVVGLLLLADGQPRLEQVSVARNPANGSLARAVHGLSLTSDGREVVVSADDGVRVFAIGSSKSRKLVLTDLDPEDPQRTISVTGYGIRASRKPDNVRVALGLGGRAEVLDLAINESIKHPFAGGEFVTSVFSSDETLIANAVYVPDKPLPGLVLVWNIEHGTESLHIRTASRVRDVQFGELDGAEVVASAHDDEMIRIWRLNNDEPTSEPTWDSEERWLAWQRKFGLTLDGIKAVPLGSGGAQPATSHFASPCRADQMPSRRP